MRPIRWAAAALVVMTAGCGESPGDAIEASGTVEATEADLGFQLPGRVDSVLVMEGAEVSAGARLALLDRTELEARVAAARAQTDAQRARLRELEGGYRPEELTQARASTRAAEQRFADAARDLERTRNLFAGGALSRQALDRAETAAEITHAERDRAQAQVQMLEQGYRPEQVAAQRAALAQAVAGLQQAEAALGYTEVVAPFGGRVTQRHREPGEIVPAGAPIVTMINPGDRWVRIYVREDRVGRLTLGGSAEIRIDAFPARVYRGEIVFIADEAEFTPRTVQTREERVKLVYRVKIRVVGDTALDLKPGLSADVLLPG